MKATRRGPIIAESDGTVLVEGHPHFARSALVTACVRPSPHTSICSWKDVAHSADVAVEGTVNPAAAWYYAEPLPAEPMRGRVAFRKGVRIAQQAHPASRAFIAPAPGRAPRHLD